MNINEWEVGITSHIFLAKRSCAMFKLDRNMKFINIDSDYVKMLNLACPEVY